MSFWEVIGEDLPVKYLEKVVDKERVSPCYLFYGGIKWIRKKVSYEFAKGLNCENKKDGKPCNLCDSCKKIEEGIHPDFFHIKPEGILAKIGIDRVREVKQRVYFSPLEGKWRVVLIEDAQGLTPEAANSLLKILEEPVSSTTFILLSPSMEFLLPTIVSRCERIRFSIPPKEKILKLIESLSGWDKEKSSIFYSLTGGDEELLHLWKEIDMWKIRKETFKGAGEKNATFSEVLSLVGLVDRKIKKLREKWKKEIEEKVKKLEEIKEKTLSEGAKDNYLAEMEEKVNTFFNWVISILYSLFWDALMYKKGRRDIINFDNLGLVKEISQETFEEIEGKLEKLENSRMLLERKVNSLLFFTDVFWNLLSVRR